MSLSKNNAHGEHAWFSFILGSIPVQEAIDGIGEKWSWIYLNSGFVRSLI